MKNIEIKAKIDNPGFIRDTLVSKNAKYRGTDFQTDTYFNVQKGRMKLREGNIENSLIYYYRENTAGPKKSDIILFKFCPDESLKNILIKALGIWKIVKKKREIYFIGNVKFHIDEIENLGSFFEIEVIDYNDTLPETDMRKVCNNYLELFKINPENLIKESYSDLVPQ
jgi:predicted adenylyl cyclase CyaB